MKFPILCPYCGKSIKNNEFDEHMDKLHTTGKRSGD